MIEEKATYRYLISKKYIDMFLILDEKQITVRECSKILKMERYHLSNVTNRFIKEGYISKNKTKLGLTKKGSELTNMLRNLKNHIENNKVKINIEKIEIIGDKNV